MTFIESYVVIAILSSPLTLADLSPIRKSTAVPVVAVEQLSYCTTIDQDVVPPCVGIYSRNFVLENGNLLQPIKFPASYRAFIRDAAAGNRVVYNH